MIDCVVVTGWTKEEGGKLEADTMINAINTAIITRPPSLTITGYYAPVIRLDNIDSYRDWETDRKSTRLNSSHSAKSRMPSSA